jgi:hypothetical protein
MSKFFALAEFAEMSKERKAYWANATPIGFIFWIWHQSLKFIVGLIIVYPNSSILMFPLLSRICYFKSNQDTSDGYLVRS